MKTSKFKIIFSMIALAFFVAPLLSCSTPTKEQTSDPFSEIITAYLSVKDALISTDGVAAQSAAKTLVATLKEQKGELVEKIKFDAEHISETTDIGHQRDHFETISDNLFQLLKSKEYVGAKLYRQYCPMAFNNKGAYWISNSKEVLNPYFGDKMLKCGMVKEIL